MSRSEIKLAQTFLDKCWAILHELPAKCIGDITPTSNIRTVTGDRILVTTSPDGSHFVMHVYRHGLVTIDIQFVGKEPLHKHLASQITVQNIKRIENEIKVAVGKKCKYTRSLQRGEVCPYFLTGGHTLFEFKSPLKLLAEKDSKWQNIKIYKTSEFGAIMALDDDINEWDVDDIYNPALLGTSRNSYVDKTVFVLGGGGGGILSDLLKRSPRYVVLVENIDVYELCRQHLKRAVQKLEGPNYKIMIEDCHKVLKDYHESGVKFDFIINDLSEGFPNEQEDRVDNTEDPESNLLTSCLNVLSHDGKYLTRGRTITDVDFLDMIERTFTNHEAGLTYEKFTVNIPAFNEDYCFYEVTRKNGVIMNGST